MTMLENFIQWQNENNVACFDQEPDYIEDKSNHKLAFRYNLNAKEIENEKLKAKPKINKQPNYRFASFIPLCIIRNTKCISYNGN